MVYRKFDQIDAFDSEPILDISPKKRKSSIRKKYRFFYHYFKGKNKMSVHFRNTCTVVSNVQCIMPCETKWKPTQPKLVMQGFAHNVQIIKDIAYIS